MTTKTLVERPEIYDQIANNAWNATGARLVVLATFEPLTGVVRCQAVAGLGSVPAQRAKLAVRRLFPSFDPGLVETAAQVNDLQETVFLRGEAVTGPFADVARHVVPDVILRIAQRFLGLRYSTVQPLMVDGAVAGSLSFHTDEMPGEAAFRSYEAFTKQACQTLEQALLLERLQTQVEGLREARQRVSASTEAVRQEIAETLHGPVQTQLLIADFSLQRAIDLVDLAPAQAKEAIADARSKIDDVREKDIRQVSHLLHPSVLKLGLGPALRSLGERFRRVMDVRVDIDRRLDGLGGTSEVGVGPATRLVAYRIVEEGLANAHRHGNATSVEVQAWLEEGHRLVVSIVDNGAGLKDGAATPGMGLQMVAMKVHEAGGHWELTPGAHGGACLKIDLPVSEVVESVESSRSGGTALGEDVLRALVAG